MIDLSKLSKEQLDIADMIIKECERQGVDPNLVLPLAYAESRFNPKAVGADGDVGVMQIMPETAKLLKINPNILSENIKGGVSYFKSIYSRFNNDAEKAYIGYNAGPDHKFFKTGDLKDAPYKSLTHLENILTYAGKGQPEEEKSPFDLTAPKNGPAPEGSLASNEENVNAAEIEKSPFDFDFAEYEKKQQSSKPKYDFDVAGDIMAGGVGAGVGATAGGAYMLGKNAPTAGNIANAITTINQAGGAGGTKTPSGSPASVRNWAWSQGGQDRGANTYAQAHEFESGTRQGATRVDPKTGREMKPTFRFAKPPVYETPPTGGLQQAKNVAGTVAANPIVRGGLGAAGVAAGANETMNRAKNDDLLGAGLSALSTVGSAAAMVPKTSVPGTAISLGGAGALALADRVRNKLDQEQQANPEGPAEPTAEEYHQATQPAFTMPKMLPKRKNPDEITSSLLESIGQQLEQFANQPPPQGQPTGMA
tara:strand:+ start:3837 stop:5276 length:1440 start_codon:yes stop_codon:yes gene_type:complete